MGNFTFKVTGEVVEAIQVDDEMAPHIRNWCGGRLVVEHDALDDEKTSSGINVPTLAGPQRASKGDWVIRRPEGDFYIRGPREFSENYTLAPNPV